MVSRKPPIIGIDLGTTYCCVGYLNPDKVVEIIENREGNKTTPSYVAFTDNDTIIGRVAKQKLFRTPENVVYDSKRLIGQKYEEAFLASTVKHNWPFKISPAEDENLTIEITQNGHIKKYKPEDISAILLKHMKTMAEERLDTKVTKAVITVPAHFNYHQRTATKKAGELAGFNIVKIINEPTAAALAYVHKNKLSGEAQNILVFDLGGGTFDVSIVTVKGNSVTVKATAGDTALGGRDFDNNLSKFIAEKIERQSKNKIKANYAAMRRIEGQSEKMKIDLSSDTIAYLDLPVLVNGKDVALEITRSEFEQINSHLFEVCMNTVEDCLRDANLTKMEIDKIVLVGGSTRIPSIQETLSQSFHGKQLSRAINPDEAVAYGAAVQAAMYNHGDKMEVSYEVNDVTPLSLGISVSANLMSVLIPRNSILPISFTKGFRTSVTNQAAVSILIYEGERPLIEHNTLIGKISLKLPPKPVAYPFYLTFCINADGILEVSTKTTDCNYTSLTITYEKSNSQRTTNVLKSAEENKTKDKNFCKFAETWSALRLYNEKMKSICDYNTKGITDEEKNTIRNICEEVAVWTERNKVKDGHTLSEVAILEQIDYIELICEPIVNSYGYYVKNMTGDDFHKLLSK